MSHLSTQKRVRYFPTLSMAPIAKVILLYLATSLFLCSCSVLGQPSELFEEDPINLRSAERVRNEPSMARQNDELEQIRKIVFERLMQLANTYPNDKMKRDDDIPPGFIGVRGRRTPRTVKRSPVSDQDLHDLLRRLIQDQSGNLRSGNPFIKGQSKKSDAYKDGFLGVRG